MKKSTKTVLTLLCAAALIAASVFGTYAYLTSKDAVTNTFTVGNVEIKLDEAKVDTNGTPTTPAERVKANNYHLSPGHEYTKDPTVTVLAGSDACYIRMVVTISDIADVDTVFAAHPNDADWTMEKIFSGYDASVWESKGSVTNYNDSQEKVSRTFTFWYCAGTGTDPNDKYIHAANTAEDALDALFDKLVIPGTITNEELTSIADMTIHIEAHAIQADGFKDAQAAWDAFPTTTNP